MDENEVRQWIEEHPKEAEMIADSLTPIMASLVEAFKPIFDIMQELMNKIYKEIEDNYPELIEIIKYKLKEVEKNES